jgi:hypothetical protein
MHEEAILNTAHPALGNVGDTITILDVTAVFNSTATANATTSYKCANSSCGVALTAVIVDNTKIGRKTSPSSYFRAKGSHTAGCSRKSSPSASTLVAPVVIKLPANPKKSNIPAVWIDSLQPQVSSNNNKNIAINNPNSPSSNYPTQQRSTVGAGTSKGQSQLLSKFVSAWKSMNVPTQQNTLLHAAWNTGGNYHTAFNILNYASSQDALNVGTKIHVGTVKSVFDNGSMYLISLDEKNVGGKGEDLIVSVLKSNLAGASGANLRNQLSNLSVNLPGSKFFIYVLGSFNESGNTLNLEVVHPHYLYLSH